jgi:hypothetical protein
MNTESSRICPFCAESIQPAAKVCPRCRQWLTVCSLRHPLVSALLAGIPMIAIMVVLGVAGLDRLDRIINPRPSYTAFPHALRVLESRMNWAQTKDGLRIYLTGILTNPSPVAWRDVEFESRFYDSTGVMVDAAHSHGYLTIEPGDDTAFRAVVIPGCATNDYNSYKLSVSTARNARGRF